MLLKPPKCGRVGTMVGAQRIVCRVVGVTRKFGQLEKYQLRCNAGVLDGTHSNRFLMPAQKELAGCLNFAGVETAGVPTVTAKAALAAERSSRGGGSSSGSSVPACRCKGQCGNRCKCKKQGVLCGRHCGCPHGKGGGCGNHKH